MVLVSGKEEDNKKKVLQGSASSAKLQQQQQQEEKNEEAGILNTLSIITDNLETYQGRDTIITLTHYIALIVADLCTVYGYKRRVSERFVNMYVQLSNCRVMLRLFDDFGAIREYWRFRKSQQIKVPQHLSSSLLFFSLSLSFFLFFVMLYCYNFNYFLFNILLNNYSFFLLQIYINSKRFTHM